MGHPCQDAAYERRARRSARQRHHHDAPPGGSGRSGNRCVGTAKSSGSSYVSSYVYWPMLSSKRLIRTRTNDGCRAIAPSGTCCDLRLDRLRVGDTSQVITMNASSQSSGIAQTINVESSLGPMLVMSSACSSRSTASADLTPSTALHPCPWTRTRNAGASTRTWNRPRSRTCCSTAASSSPAPCGQPTATTTRRLATPSWRSPSPRPSPAPLPVHPWPHLSRPPRQETPVHEPPPCVR
jgi:hypothetical protein